MVHRIWLLLRRHGLGRCLHQCRRVDSSGVRAARALARLASTDASARQLPTRKRCIGLHRDLYSGLLLPSLLSFGLDLRLRNHLHLEGEVGRRTRTNAGQFQCHM